MAEPLIVMSESAVRALLEDAAERGAARALAKHSPANPAEVLDAGEAALLLRVSRRQIAKLAAAGTLPSVRVGRLLRIRRADALALLEQREAG